MQRPTQMTGYKCLGGEALPSVASAAFICPNPPVGTVYAMLTVRAAGICATFDGTTAPTTAVGCDFATGTHDLFLNATELKKVKAIASSGTPTGYISYFGLA